MDHFTQVYWDKKGRDEKARKIKDRNYQTFWVNYNKKLVTYIWNHQINFIIGGTRRKLESEI